jgi:nucleoside-diphosphate-sugar epimerase
MSQKPTVLVTGGAGFVGAALVPQLLAEGYRVRVLDLYLYGSRVFDDLRPNPDLLELEGDIRNRELVRRAVKGAEAVLHLACISNDPSFELNPSLGRSINFDAFEPLVDESVSAGVRRFIYASSSSVYGISDAEKVDEDHPLDPLTDYSKYKAMCEPILLSRQSKDFTTLVIRPATLCGYTRRLRLDLTVNILTAHAFHNGRIRVFGGSQQRSHLHVADMCRYYLNLLQRDPLEIAGNIYNTSYRNDRVGDLAEMVRAIASERLKRPIEIETVPTDDQRSYRVTSEKIREELGLVPESTIEDAIVELLDAFSEGRVPRAMEDDLYYNVRRMKRVSLS